jgi:hypothetical protein
MKFGWAIGLLLVPYGSLIPGTSAGNPNDDAYIGQPDSTYDIAANPPRTDGVVSYNPYAPLPAPSAAPAMGNGAAAPAR